MAYEADLTFVLAASKRECFYHPLRPGNAVELDYQVVEGGQMDVNFALLSPSNKFVINDLRKQDAEHRYVATETGDYKFCFDNTFSRFTEKVIFFELYVDAPSDPDGTTEGDVPEEYDEERLDMKVDDLKDSLRELKKSMDSVKHSQNQFRNVELRDRSAAENNFSRVNFWSIVNSVCMVVASVGQVVAIRSLFYTKRSVTA